MPLRRASYGKVGNHLEFTKALLEGTWEEG